ncbi:PACE efflux transporter [Rhodoferax sp. WC2427]|uniref:PACE efflux transporter n=1 Tax=Rhodoferax sp. WC2427 TaxID=3234144 RepID=UPI0034656230
MQGMKRKFVYVSLYEGFAIVAATLGLAGMSGQGMHAAGILAVATSAIAIVWNLVFNTLFERWEARQAVRGRSLARRVAHAVGFEGGLTVIFVPLMAWWLDTTWWQALAMDLGLLLFFLVYTFAFNWAFDRVFGLPASALQAA